MATKWDDGDDVVRPSVSGPASKDVRGAVDDWQSKMKSAAAAQADERARAAADAITTTDPAQRAIVEDAVDKEREKKVVVKEVRASPPPPMPDVIKKLATQARASANDVAKKAKANRRVRLRVRVPGWYPGSVPAVDYMDGNMHYFPRAPSDALDCEAHYLEYWRKPFIEQLRSLGFDVVENDL